jgi:hypothetical protein
VAIQVAADRINVGTHVHFSGVVPLQYHRPLWVGLGHRHVCGFGQVYGLVLTKRRCQGLIWLQGDRTIYLSPPRA